MSAAKKIDAGKFLFREGDPPDAMYVVKTGKLAVVKVKANAEIVLAEIGPGAMVGEMAFFDQQPRSASIKAMKDTEVIPLPFKALHGQFQNFPEWAKAIMKQISKNLRSANQRIKQLEKAQTEEKDFPDHLLSKLLTILCLVAERYGTEEKEGLVVPSGILRNVTIQVFQEPTNKMQKLMQVLADLQKILIEDLGEGRQKITMLALNELFEFAEWWNEFLFKKESSQMWINPAELRVLQALAHFSQKSEANHQGVVQCNLTEIVESCETQLNFKLKFEDFDMLVQKKILSEKIMKNGTLLSTFQKEEVNKLLRCWSLQHQLQAKLN